MSEDGTVVVPFEEDLLGPPPRLTGAPTWAQGLSDRIHEMELRQQRDRHRLAREVTLLQGDVRQMNTKLGKEPDSDGAGGEGLIGDLRKTMRDVAALVDLKKMGIGAIGAITIFGALIILGVTHFIQSVSGSAK